MAESVKNVPVVQETGVQSQGGEDPLEKEIATTPVFWKIPRIEEPGGLESMGSRSRIQFRD